MRDALRSTYDYLVDGTKRCVQSVFVPEWHVVTLASELIVDPADADAAMFSIAIRRDGSGKVISVSLHGAEEVAIEEHGKRRINFILKSDALAYLQATVMALGTKRPDLWHT
jgi:hypothetical protein